MRINLCLLLFLVLLNISCNSKRAGKKKMLKKILMPIQARFTIMVNIIIPMKLMSKYICG